MSRSDQSNSGSAPTDKALPAEIQEHLGRKLRTTLAVESEKPAFLGDEALPPRFEGYIRRLEQSDRPAQHGLAAVRRALDLDGPPEPAQDWQTGQKKVERPD